MYRVAVIVEPAGDNYSAYSPSLPGCIATGQTVSQTIERFREAVVWHLDALQHAHQPLPVPPTEVLTIEVDR